MATRRVTNGRPEWILDQRRFLTQPQLRRLLTKCCQCKSAQRSQRRSANRAWFIVRLAAETGLRLKEIVELNCGDLILRSEGSAVLVRYGKGGRRRLVHIRKEFSRDIDGYLRWKRQVGEETQHDSPVL
ncbi:MAG: hypothetical protein E4H02_11585, partial [Lentisphaerales bacterium]